MKKAIIGKKVGMTQIFDEAGKVIPVTVIEAGPCVVTAKMTEEKEGYTAVQLGYEEVSEKKLSKPEQGHLKKAGVGMVKHLKEFRLAETDKFEVGDVLKADIFAKDEFVDVTGQTKGRGFAGVVRRWKFGGGRASHGGAWVRRSGSIGMCAAPGKVYKGRKMPGHMGDVRQTILNLKVMDVRPDVNLLLVKGSIPGANGCFVIVRNAIKKH